MYDFILEQRKLISYVELMKKMNKFDVIDMKITTDYKKKSYR